MLRFGNVVVDVGRGSLRSNDGAEIALRPKSLDLLLALARNPGRVMSRDAPFDAVWPDVTVTEDSIAQCVREIRRASGDPEGQILRTIIKRGDCLDVEVRTTSKLDAPDNITPIFLPPRAPEMNPVENVWQYLRQNWLSNTVFENYDAIIDAIIDAACAVWRKLIAKPETITSIGLRDWAHVGQPP